MKKLRFLSFAALSALVVFSCKKEVNATSAGKTGSLKVRMTDTPGSFSGLFVEIVKVEAFLEGEGWVTLNANTQVVSVLDLTNGAETTLALDQSVEAGVYSKIRLTFGSDNSLMLLAGSAVSTVGLNFSSQFSQQVVIEIDEQVSAGATTEVLLDFNVAQSVIQLASLYFINPVITEIEDEATGVQGDVQGSAQASVTLSNGQFSYNTYISASGEFLMRGVENGTYTLHVQGMQNGSATVNETTVSNVVVTEGQIQNVGAINL